MEYYSIFMVKIDKNDQKLIELLQEDSKRSIQELAQRAGLPPTTVHNRIKKLEQLGVIVRYTAVVNAAKLGKHVTAFVLVTTSSRTPAGVRVNQDDIAREIRALGAQEVHVVTGSADIIAQVIAKDLDELNAFVTQKLRSLDGVDKTQTMLVLSSY
jgi:DNA-binding Lrp family transcriptional regulator